MTIKKYSIVTVISIATLILILLYTFFVSSTKAYADEITEATVTSEGSEVTTADSAQVVQTSRQAPVSIAVYSNEVTESSDTYDYSTKVDTNNPVEITVPAATDAPVAPSQGTEVTPTTQAPSTGSAPVARDPRSTAAPDATEEPDILTYEATVAPAYKD